MVVDIRHNETQASLKRKKVTQLKLVPKLLEFLKAVKMTENDFIRNPYSK